MNAVSEIVIYYMQYSCRLIYNFVYVKFDDFYVNVISPLLHCTKERKKKNF